MTGVDNGFCGRGKYAKQREREEQDSAIIFESWRNVLVPDFVAAVGYNKTVEKGRIGHYIGGMSEHELPLLRLSSVSCVLISLSGGLSRLSRSRVSLCNF